MISISSQDASRQFDALLTKVAEGDEHVSIQSPAHTPVYLIPEEDFELFQALLQWLEDQEDIASAESRTTDALQERVEFDQFFDELEHDEQTVKE